MILTIKINNEDNSLKKNQGVKNFTLVTCSEADPGSPVGGGANPPGGANIWFCQIFQKLNCMKLRKFWAEGAPPLDPPLSLD